MNELWSIDADVTLGFRVQLMNKIVVVGLMFSFAIPLLYLLIFFYLWSAHWVDRYIFLRRLTPPPVTHDGLMEVVLNYIFPAAIMLHLVMSVIFFNDICAGSKNADNDVCNKIFGDTFYNSSNSSTWDNLFLPNTTRLDTCTAMPSERLDLSNPDALYAVFAAQDDWQKRMRDDSMFDFASATIHSLECLVSNASQVTTSRPPLACHPLPLDRLRARPPAQPALSLLALPFAHGRRVHCASRCRAARSPSRGRTSSSSLDVPSSASSRFCTSFSPPRASNGGATAPSPPPQLSRTPPQPTFSFKSTVSSCSATSTWRASLRMRTSMRASGCLARVDRCPHRPRRCPHKRSPSRESRKPIAHASTRHQLPTASATLGRPRRRLLLARIIRRPF